MGRVPESGCAAIEPANANVQAFYERVSFSRMELLFMEKHLRDDTLLR